MILRIEEAMLRSEFRSRLVAQLRRELVAMEAGPDDRSVLTVGFRSVGSVTQLLVASLAAEDALATRSFARLDSEPFAELVERSTSAIFELEELLGQAAPSLEAPALGLLRGHVTRGLEAIAHGMIRNVVQEVEPAGVIGLYTGRRVLVDDEELIVVALWRDRLLLHEFARSRSAGAIDPAFARTMSSWSFLTYDCLSPSRLLLPARGPALLLVDDERRLVDVSPGVESVIGFPGELILGRTLDELSPEPEALRSTWLEFIRDGARSGTSVIAAPTGEQATVAWRAERHADRPGLTLIHLAPVADASLERRLPELVVEAFPSIASAG